VTIRLGPSRRAVSPEGIDGLAAAAMSVLWRLARSVSLVPILMGIATFHVSTNLHIGTADASTLTAFGVVDEASAVWWQQERSTALAAGLIVALETALVIALVRAAERRREAQRMLEERLRIEMLVNEMLFVLGSTPPASFDEALDRQLRRIADDLHIEAAVRWRSGDPADSEWDSPELRHGRPGLLSSLDALPATVRQRWDGRLSMTSAVALSLAADTHVRDAIFWMSSKPLAQWRVRPADLLLIASAAGNVRQRKDAEAELEGRNVFRRAILDSLESRVAVLDRSGVILDINAAWDHSGFANETRWLPAAGPGTNYLAICAAAASDPLAADALAIVREACEGQRPGRQVEYSCESGEEHRWFLMTAEPLRRPEGGAVVSHTDITQRKLNELALRESEDRFRRLTDTLPVGIWMSDASGSRNYFNRHWLTFSGSTVSDQSGFGWLEGVHPDDREGWLQTYLSAFHSRQPFRMEYRLRRYDGVYRWVVSTGHPRYDADGVFHGYIGGSLDITERREAEQMLRDVNRRLIAAQEDERARIARELHDHLSQQLALLAIDLQRLSMQPPETPEEMTAALHEEWRRTAEIASDVHAISHRLHPSKLETLGLVTTLRAHCRDMSRQSLIAHFSEHAVPPNPPDDVALCLFRVAEEALTNVLRHSGGGEAYVSLIGSPFDIILRVADSGCGFDIDAGGGIGLVGMRERLESINGTLTITSTPGMGTVVEARVPLSTAPPGEVTTEVEAQEPGLFEDDISAHAESA
jgi:PAS domain S-box-containing protein